MRTHLILFIALQAAAVGAFADCGALLLGGDRPGRLAVGERREKIWNLGRQAVPYTQLGLEKNRRGYYAVNDIVAPEVQARTMIYGVQNEHPYIWYRGYRLDTSGEAGIRVVTKMTKSKYLYGDMIFVLSDLPPEAVAKLDGIIQNFQSQNHLTCARAACSYINVADSTILKNHNYRTTSRTIKALVAEKARGRSIEILTTSTAEPKALFKRITDTESTVQTNLFLGGMLASVIPFAGVSVLLQLVL